MLRRGLAGRVVDLDFEAALDGVALVAGADEDAAVGAGGHLELAAQHEVVEGLFVVGDVGAGLVGVDGAVGLTCEDEAARRL